MEHACWILKAHLPALLRLLAQAAQAPLPAEATDALGYAVHGTDADAGLWADYPFPPTSPWRARLALDADDRDVLHLALSLPTDLCNRVDLLALESPFL
jgi:hypothetical protein